VRVARLRSSPVKGLRQQGLDELELVSAGIAGDRRFVCTDDRDRRLYSLDLGPLSAATARWDEPQGTLEVVLPDGQSVVSPIELAGEEQELRAPADARMVGRRVLGPLAGTLSEVAGRTLRLYHVPVGHGSPGPITLLGDGSLARLARELGLAALDSRRFKMSIELEGVAEHAEDGWEGAALRVGAAVLEVGGPVPRCALVTREPDTGARDLDTLRALLAYRRPMDTGEAPFGVYATVQEPGTVTLGDRVELV
jgi:uncharacterized protein YcbX